MIEVELRCPACGIAKTYWVRQAPESLNYTCQNPSCGEFYRVLSWDEAHCEVVGPPEALAARAEAKRGALECVDGLINAKRSRSRRWQLEQARSMVSEENNNG